YKIHRFVTYLILHISNCFLKQKIFRNKMKLKLNKFSPHETLVICMIMVRDFTYEKSIEV
ncbi:hypothetical protein, partial [Pantoea stewartii]|uniref:hypothetical protein n=1 Tax=Pantoea stewartii TaxID=66269 RepID=UPI000A693C49